MKNSIYANCTSKNIIQKANVIKGIYANFMFTTVYTAGEGLFLIRFREEFISHPIHLSLDGTPIFHIRGHGFHTHHGHT